MSLRHRSQQTLPGTCMEHPWTTVAVFALAGRLATSCYRSAATAFTTCDHNHRGAPSPEGPRPSVCKAVPALSESTYDSSRVVALHSTIRVHLYIGMSKDCFVTLRQAIAPLAHTLHRALDIVMRQNNGLHRYDMRYNVMQLQDSF